MTHGHAGVSRPAHPAAEPPQRRQPGCEGEVGAVAGYDQGDAVASRRDDAGDAGGIDPVRVNDVGGPAQFHRVTGERRQERGDLQRQPGAFPQVGDDAPEAGRQ